MALSVTIPLDVDLSDKIKMDLSDTLESNAGIVHLPCHGHKKCHLNGSGMLMEWPACSFVSVTTDGNATSVTADFNGLVLELVPSTAPDRAIPWTASGPRGPDVRTTWILSTTAIPIDYLIFSAIVLTTDGEFDKITLVKRKDSKITPRTIPNITLAKDQFDKRYGTTIRDIMIASGVLEFVARSQ
jgi:hypothetical protein